MMKALKILAVLCLTVAAFPAWGAGSKRAEVLAVLKTPAGMTLTEESLTNGRIRRYIEITAESAGAELSSIFDSLSLMNKDGHIFVFFTSDKMTSDELVSVLKKDPNVFSASPNREVHMH